MKVELEKTYPMPAQPEAAWALLQDIPRVAACMPGAKITERIDDTHYKGTVSIRVGPAVMAFRGEVEVRELDAGSRMLHLIGKGSDTTGSSGASMDLVAHIEPADGGSQLRGRSEVTVSGKAAAFGGRMMTTVAEQILGQFAANFARELKARGAEAVVAAPAAPAAPDAPAASEAPAPRAAGGGAAAAQAPPAAEVWRPAAQPVGAAGGELNALTLLWAVIRDWFRGLFRRRPA